MSDAGLDAGRRALAGVDQLLREQPNRNDVLLAAVTNDLCRFRDLLIARREAGEPEGGRQLDQLNAVISVVAAVHFPLGETPWGELQGARDWLAPLVEARSAGQPVVAGRHG